MGEKDDYERTAFFGGIQIQLLTKKKTNKELFVQ